jgi:hypothetical protein
MLHARPESTDTTLQQISLQRTSWCDAAVRRTGVTTGEQYGWDTTGSYLADLCNHAPNPVSHATKMPHQANTVPSTVVARARTVASAHHYLALQVPHASNAHKEVLLVI